MSQPEQKNKDTVDVEACKQYEQHTVENNSLGCTLTDVTSIDNADDNDVINNTSYVLGYN